MDFSLIGTIAQVVIAGGLITAVLLHFREWPKSKAEVAKMTAETEGAEWSRFQKEIGRLEERLARVERENEDLRQKIDRQRGRENTLEKENTELRKQVRHLEMRLAALESLFRTHPLTPEMKAAIEALE